MFSILQNDVKTLKDEVHFFQAELSPSVEDYLPDILPVSFMLSIHIHTVASILVQYYVYILQPSPAIIKSDSEILNKVEENQHSDQIRTTSGKCKCACIDFVLQFTKAIA